MATLAISDELFERVARIARVRGMPVERQAEELLAEAVDRGTHRKQLLKVFDEIAAMTPKGTAQTDSVSFLREDRDR